jgi:hypothetical protein
MLTVWGENYLPGINTCKEKEQESGLGRGNGQKERQLGITYFLLVCPYKTKMRMPYIPIPLSHLMHTALGKMTLQWLILK